MKTIRIQITEGYLANTTLTFKQKRNGSVRVTCSDRKETLVIQQVRDGQKSVVLTDGETHVLTKNENWVMYAKEGRTNLGAVDLAHSARAAFVDGWDLVW